MPVESATVPATGMTMAEPPSPPGHPRLGHLIPMREDPMGFLAATARQYGGIAKLRFPNDTVYLVSEPDLIKELLIDHGQKYRKNTRYKHLQRVLGQGLLLSEGESWRSQRKVAQPFFTPKGIAAHSPAVADIMLQSLESWKPLVERGNSVDTMHMFSRIVQKQALQFIVGPMYARNADAIAHHVEIAINNWPQRPRGRFAWIRLPPLLRFLRLKRAFDAIDALFFNYIDTYRRERPEQAGMLHALAGAQDESQPLAARNQSLRDQMVTLFLAAFETSESSLCWTFYLLDQHPKVREQLHAEIDSALHGRVPTVEDFENLPLLDRVISESLRLYSPIHSLSRVALEDDTIGGYRIPKGATVMVSLYATHRLPHHWPDPDRFDPDRFLPENSAGRHRYAFIPFAIGHRSCIGGHQAMVNAKINIALIAQRYVLKLVPGHPVIPDARTTMRPRHGMMMAIHAR